MFSADTSSKAFSQLLDECTQTQTHSLGPFPGQVMRQHQAQQPEEAGAPLAPCSPDAWDTLVDEVP